MNAAVERSGNDAYLHFEKAMNLLRDICGCSVYCDRQAARLNFTNLRSQERKPLYHVQSDDNGRCLQQLAHTIIQLARQLSTIASKPNDLRLRRRGLDALYKRVSQIRRDPPKSEDAYLRALDSMDLLDLAMLVFGVEQPFTYDRPAYSQRPMESTVIVSRGLCFVKTCVEKLTSSAEELLCVHIIPGQIEWKERIYSKVRDGRISSPNFLMSPVGFPTSTAQYRAQVQLLDNMVATAVVTESAECLRMSYEIKTSLGTFFLGPGALCHEIAKNN